MQFGRPDVPGDDDDGGMIDVSHVPGVLASSLGLTSPERHLPAPHVNSLAGSAAQTSWQRMHNFNQIVWTPYSMGCCSPERRYRERTAGHPVRAVNKTCHLCGRSLRSVTAHLRVHGWTKAAYCAVFGLEPGQSLEGPETRKLRAAAFASRLVFDPAVRAGSAAGRNRARTGELTRDAATAARGRPFPEQRRRKARRARAAMPPAAIAQAARDRAGRHLARVAAAVAQRHGYPDIGAFVLARIAAGASLADISREAGLHKDWLSRHLCEVEAAAAAAAAARLPQRWDARWRPALNRLGFTDVASYLAERHILQHRTVNGIAAEALPDPPRRRGRAAPARADADSTCRKAPAARERAAQVWPLA